MDFSCQNRQILTTKVHPRIVKDNPEVQFQEEASYFVQAPISDDVVSLFPFMPLVFLNVETIYIRSDSIKR